MTDPEPPAPHRRSGRKRQPLGQTIGGVLFGFEQQVFRGAPPPHELVHHARPDASVPAGDGGFVTIELPGAIPAGGQPDASLGAMTDEPSAPGSRPAPAGFPDTLPRPPVIAEPGDPFSMVRVIDAVARMDRGRPVRLDDLVDRLNATHLDWLFTRPVIVDALVALQANWMADYRNASGIVLDDGERGPQVTLEDSSRVDPWLVQQAGRAVRACQDALDDFARRDSAYGAG